MFKQYLGAITYTYTHAHIRPQTQTLTHAENLKKKDKTDRNKQWDFL